MRTPRERRRSGRAGKAKRREKPKPSKPLPPGVPASGSLADLPVPPKQPGDNQGGAALTLVLQAQVVALMRAGADLAFMIESIQRANPHVHKHDVANAYAAILREWKLMAKEDKATSRVTVVARLKHDLANIRAGEQEQIFEELPDPKNPSKFIRRVRNVRRINWNAVRGHERLLAQIEGTLAPIKIQVRTDELAREGLAERIAAMDADEVELRIQQATERRRVITTTGHEVQAPAASIRGGA